MPHHETSSSDMTEEVTKVEADRVLSFWPSSMSRSFSRFMTWIMASPLQVGATWTSARQLGLLCWKMLKPKKRSKLLSICCFVQSAVRMINTYNPLVIIHNAFLSNKLKNWSHISWYFLYFWSISEVCCLFAWFACLLTHSHQLSSNFPPTFNSTPALSALPSVSSRSMPRAEQLLEPILSKRVPRELVQTSDVLEHFTKKTKLFTFHFHWRRKVQALQPTCKILELKPKASRKPKHTKTTAMQPKHGPCCLNTIVKSCKTVKPL